MHDPMIVAFDIRYPWPFPRDKNKQLWAPKKPPRGVAITIWHVDPERHGSEDSCGWAFPVLGKRRWERLHNWAWGEGRNPWYLMAVGKSCDCPANADVLGRSLIWQVAEIIGVRLSVREVEVLTACLVHDPDDNLRGCFCHLPGYHTNNKEDDQDDRQERFTGICVSVAKNILRMRRPWWRHPRWHFWHWKIQVHAVQSLKRWLFSRCEVCGKRFPWGYAPVSGSWYGTGPRWFRGERNVRHHECTLAQPLRDGATHAEQP